MNSCDKKFSKRSKQFFIATKRAATQEARRASASDSARWSKSGRERESNRPGQRGGGPAPARAGGGGPRPAPKNQKSRNRASESTKFLFEFMVQVIKSIFENAMLSHRFKKFFFKREYTIRRGGGSRIAHTSLNFRSLRPLREKRSGMRKKFHQKIFFLSTLIFYAFEIAFEFIFVTLKITNGNV